jgi:molybdate/tungstate transport system permease protein
MTLRARPTFVIFGLLGAGLLVTLLLPILDLAVHADLNGWRTALRTAPALDAIKTSLIASTIALFIMSLLGVPLGYVFARARLRLRRLWISLVFLPLVVPDLAGGILLLRTFGPYGVIGQALSTHHIEATNNLLGIILAQLFVASPFVVISSFAAFANVDPKLELAAATLGDSRWHIFRRVSLPLAWPGIAAGVTLAWIRALGEFGTTLIMAYNPHTLPVYMWVKFESDGLAGAMPVTFCLVILAIAAVVIAMVINHLKGHVDLVAPIGASLEG